MAYRPGTDLETIDRDKFDGVWSLGVEVLDWMLEMIPFGETVFLFGAGQTNPELEKRWLVPTIEHDGNYAAQYGAVHAPLINGWYDVSIVERELARYSPYCILVDGPPGKPTRRGDLLTYMQMSKFGHPRYWIFDDTHRKEERNLCLRVARMVASVDSLPKNIGGAGLTYLECQHKQAGVVAVSGSSV